MLKLDNVVKQFGKLVAVKGISLEIPDGQIRGLIGPNGSGTTTMFHLMSGFLRATSGNIRFQETDITKMRSHRIAKLGLVRTFQLTSIYRDLTVRENVMMGHHARLGRRRKNDSHVGRLPHFDSPEESTDWILDFMGFNDEADTMARLLPAGMQRVLSISTALAVRPLLIMLDEPLAGLNPTEKQVVAQKILGLREHGLTVLLVEHDVRSVLSICDLITVINFGSKIAEGTADEITNNQDVIEAYLGKPADYDT